MDRLKTLDICIFDDSGKAHCGVLTSESRQFILSLFEPKPDESRLLSDTEMHDLKRISYNPNADEVELFMTALRAIAQAQDAKTASIVRVECAKEKAEFGLSVHESSRAMTLKEVIDWLEDNFEPTVPMSLDYKKWHKKRKEWLPSEKEKMS